MLGFDAAANLARVEWRTALRFAVAFSAALSTRLHWRERRPSRHARTSFGSMTMSFC